LKNSKKYFILGGVIFSILIVATFFDLQISFLLADLSPGEIITSNLFAIIFEIIGEGALYFFLAFAFAVIFWWLKFNIKNNLKYFYQVVISILIFLTFFIFINKAIIYLSNYMTIEFNYYFLIFSISVAIILTILSILSLKFFKQKQINVLIKFAFVIICVVFVSNLITQISKTFVFGRIRFKAMNYLEDFSFYTPWFFLNGTGLFENLQQAGLTADMFKSFPSGHVTATAITFTLICLPCLFKKFKSKFWKIFCWATPVVLILIVGLARIIAGAHFLSDVLMAGLVTLLVTLFFKHRFIDKENKTKINNK
jgi:membrane-associated phospholipid phosphatase